MSMDKENVIHRHPRILFSYKNEGNYFICNMAESMGIKLN